MSYRVGGKRFQSSQFGGESIFAFLFRQIFEAFVDQFETLSKRNVNQRNLTQTQPSSLFQAD